MVYDVRHPLNIIDLLCTYTVAIWYSNSTVK